MARLVFAPFNTRSSELKELNKTSCEMYETNGDATHDARTTLGETVLLFPLSHGEYLALCYREDEYGDYEECADEWNLGEHDLEDIGDGYLALDTSTALF